MAQLGLVGTGYTALIRHGMRHQLGIQPTKAFPIVMLQLQGSDAFARGRGSQTYLKNLHFGGLTWDHPSLRPCGRL